MFRFARFVNRFRYRNIFCFVWELFFCWQGLHCISPLPNIHRHSVTLCRRMGTPKGWQHIRQAVSTPAKNETKTPMSPIGAGETSQLPLHRQGRSRSHLHVHYLIQIWFSFSILMSDLSRNRAKTSVFCKFLPDFGFCFEKICTFVVGFNNKKIKWKR